MAARASARFEVKGFDELRRAFSRLPDRVERRVLRGAVTSSATPIVNAIKSRVKDDLGHLRRSISKRITMHAQNSVANATIGAKNTPIPVPKSVRWTKTGSVVPSKYAHLVEFGTRRGVQGRHFLERGFAAGEPRARENFRKTFARGVEREARKLGFR